MSGQVHTDRAGSTGAHRAEGAIQMLLVGARAAQVASVQYRHGLDYLGRMLNGLETRIDAHAYISMDRSRA